MTTPKASAVAAASFSQALYELAVSWRVYHQITAATFATALVSPTATTVSDPRLLRAIPLVGWRWFLDDDYIVLEPPTGVVQLRDMHYLDLHHDTLEIEAVFRSTPHVGVYLRFKLAVDFAAMNGIPPLLEKARP